MAHEHTQAETVNPKAHKRNVMAYVAALVAAGKTEGKDTKTALGLVGDSREHNIKLSWCMKWENTSCDPNMPHCEKVGGRPVHDCALLPCVLMRSSIAAVRNAFAPMALTGCGAAGLSGAS